MQELATGWQVVGLELAVVGTPQDGMPKSLSAIITGQILASRKCKHLSSLLVAFYLFCSPYEGFVWADAGAMSITNIYLSDKATNSRTHVSALHLGLVDCWND